jgi:hypothetical protein
MSYKVWREGGERREEDMRISSIIVGEELQEEGVCVR